ncbi:hypothetical protein J5Y04_01150 [Kitasatospora sp. RG8]|uniref:hypothetical protein n=1 Tax=Kitasatospora sp. RG8 TaxID=2820815 RepID=UPI001ADF39A6|nr:hypothetical protein [Kitasatospora sp. RG8]MBP0448154.1 hypothetical protein [Kitasatospora sp. RG8]
MAGEPVVGEPVVGRTVVGPSAGRSLAVRSLTVGCALAALAAGPAWACPDADPAPGTDPAAEVTAPAAPAAPAPSASDSDLEVIRIDPDPAVPGGTTTVHAFVTNTGPDRTASPFTVVITLPEGVTPEKPYFPENCYDFQNGHRVRCTFPAGLGRYRSATALIPVRLAPTVPLGELSGGYVAVRGDDDRNETDNRQPFSIQVVEAARH